MFRDLASIELTVRVLTVLVGAAIAGWFLFDVLACRSRILGERQRYA